MNKITCPNCGHQNEAGLSFCTNCGTALVNQPAPNAFPNPSSANQPHFTAQTNAKPSNTGRNLAIFGGLGCLALIIGGVALFSLLIYAGSNDNKNTSNSIANRNIVASNSKSVVNSNANSLSNTKSTSDDDSSNLDIKSSLPTQIGNFEQQGEVTTGDQAKDFPGADSIYKADYANKKGKKVNMVIAKFSSHEVARERYGYFIETFKSKGAKIVVRQKSKDKKGGDVEVAIYNYKSSTATIYETMLYSEIYGFRFTAPDQQTMKEFIQDFAKYGNAIGS